MEMERAMSRQSAEIENWSLLSSSDPKYIFQMKGIVYNHPRIPDGELVYTSLILSIDFETNIAKTLNTDYKLL